MARNPQTKAAANAVETPLANAALEKIQAQFSAKRWDKIVQQAQTSRGMDAKGLQSLCTQLLATRSARHPDNDAAALYSACNGLLIAIGSHPGAADEARFQKAFKTGEMTPLPVETAAAALPPVADVPAEIPAQA